MEGKGEAETQQTNEGDKKEAEGNREDEMGVGEKLEGEKGEQKMEGNFIRTTEEFKADKEAYNEEKSNLTQGENMMAQGKKGMTQLGGKHQGYFGMAGMQGYGGGGMMGYQYGGPMMYPSYA